LARFPRVSLKREQAAGKAELQVVTEGYISLINTSFGFLGAQLLLGKCFVLFI
jgi:hypothetical protein